MLPLYTLEQLKRKLDLKMQTVVIKEYDFLLSTHKYIKYLSLILIRVETR
jgi:hypothetical protein